MVQHLVKNELEKYLKAMTTLDIVMIPKEDAWLRLSSFAKKESVMKKNNKQIKKRNNQNDRVKIC